jgi:uncharacterized protein RhaS with RHS repeats
MKALNLIRKLLLVPVLLAWFGSSAQAFYDASVGRWLVRDPIGENGGLNLFAYVGNNPTSLSDAFGLAATATPTSGNKWTTENCYQYACNNTGKYSDIPGAKNNQRCPTPYNCDGIKKAAMSDGLTEVPSDGKCPEGTHKISYSVGQHGGSSDFHLMRQDDDGTWSHKFRYGSPSKVDGGGNAIKDPGGANQSFTPTPKQPGSSYKHCGYLCAPNMWK